MSANMHTPGETALVRSDVALLAGARPWIKRGMDIVVSLAALILLSPLIGFVAALIAWRMGRPVLFRQQRPGLAGRPFEILKFRTMRDALGQDGKLAPDSERLTRLGRFMRSTSLDELPELWNIFRGDMSLVGPRPLLMRYLDRYTPTEARRHAVQQA